MAPAGRHIRYVRTSHGQCEARLGRGKDVVQSAAVGAETFGPWTTYGGGGETIFNHVDGYQNFPFAGWLGQRDLGKKWTLGTEVFYHGAEGLATPQTRSARLIDVGGYYKFRDPGFQLLFAYGHTVAGQSENYAYVGLYWAWGHKDDKDQDKDSATAMNYFSPPGRW